MWSESRTDYAFAFPIAQNGSLFKREMLGVDFLEKVRLVQQNWVEAGTNEQYCVDPTVRHNVSNTVTVPHGEWDAVEDYLYENRHYFAGVSFLGESGDKAFHQAPNTEVLTEDQIVEKYGKAALFASGLIVDTNKGFSNLWQATFTAQQPVQAGGEQSSCKRIGLEGLMSDNYLMVIKKQKTV